MIDLSEKMIGLARVSEAQQRLGIDYIVGDGRDVRKELLEGAEPAAPADLGRGVVEELVQGLLGVPVGTLVVGVVAAPHHVLPAHGGVCLYR